MFLVFTSFSVLAAMKYEDGDQQSAERSIVYADEVSSTVFQFLSDPKLYKRLTDVVCVTGAKSLSRSNGRFL